MAEPRTGRISVEELMGLTSAPVAVPAHRPSPPQYRRQRGYHSASAAYSGGSSPVFPFMNGSMVAALVDGPGPRHMLPLMRPRFAPPPHQFNKPKGPPAKPYFVPYLSPDAVGRGLKKGELIQGVLRVNQRNYEEAFVDNPDSEQQDIMLLGLRDRNRALHNDVVVVKLKEREHWIVQENLYQAYKEGRDLSEKCTASAGDHGKDGNDRSETVSPSSSAESEDSPPQSNCVSSMGQDSSSVTKESSSLTSDPEVSVDVPKTEDAPMQPVALPRVDEGQTKVLIPMEESSEEEHSEWKVSRSSSSETSPRAIIDLQEGISYLDHPIHKMAKPCRYHYTRTRMLVLLGEMQKSAKSNGISLDFSRTIATLSLQRTTPLFDPERALQHRPPSGQRRRSPPAGAFNRPTPTPKRHNTFRKTHKTPCDFPNEYVPDSCLQKTAEVMYLMEKKNCRAAVGSLKVLADGRRDWALFSPNDSRVPRMMIPAAEVPQGFFERPQDFSKFIFIARLVDWPTTAQFACGRLYRSLGLAGEIEPETEGLLCQYDVDTKEFSQKCLACLPQVESAQSWVIPQEELDKRRDFRKEIVFTIDPTTARDMDDALHIKATGDGLFEVGVHIADVSYFVRAGTELDNWAANRATSVYLVHKVVSMLPRLLCEELCSLNSGVDRLTFSVVWKMNDKGEIMDEWFGRGVIRSCCKLTYNHAQGFLDQPDRIWEESELPAISDGIPSGEISKCVQLLNKMAVQLRKRRFDSGALRIDMPKLCFSLDAESGMPNGCTVYEQKDSNRLIEEFMLLANMAVAHKIHKHFPQTAVLRRHPPPNRKVLREVMELCEKLGYHFMGTSSAQIQQTLIKYGGMGEDARAIFAVLSQLFMKPMKLAVYFCTGTIEDDTQYRHYALNVPLYTHFTSPIRRYPDLMVHRLLAAALEYDDAPKFGPKEIQAFCEHCNDRKYAAKTVSEMSAEMFFAIFVKECGPMDAKGIVMNVMDHSFDVLLIKYGIVKRVYANKLSLAKDPDYEEGPPPTLTLHWPKTTDAKGPSNALMKRTIKMCSLVDVVLTSLPDPLKFVVLLKPCADDQ